MDKKQFQMLSTIIDGKFYRIEEFPHEDIRHKHYNKLQKGIAYHLYDSIMDYVLPYRTIIETYKELYEEERKPGIYLIGTRTKIRGYDIILPKTTNERADYSYGNRKNIAAAIVNGEYDKDQFAHYTNEMDLNGDAFIPPLLADDDPLNRIMKIAIARKNVSYEAYSPRLEALAANKGKGVEGANLKNNTKRALKVNRTMSITKALMLAQTYDLDIAIIIKDLPNRPNPILESDKALVIYPLNEFDINPDDLVNVDELTTNDLKIDNISYRDEE